jgi:hypothetical protein
MNDETPVRRRTVKKPEEQPVEEKLETKYQPTPDYVIDEVYDKAREDITKFVADQVQKMNDRLLFNEEPTFPQLNDALATYEQCTVAILSVYAAARAEDSFAREAYDDEYARCFMETRQELGLSKYASGKELETLTRARYMERLAKAKAKAITAETKLKYIDKLVDGWKQYGFVLSQLSRNAEAEARATGISTNDVTGDYAEGLARTALGDD